MTTEDATGVEALPSEDPYASDSESISFYCIDDVMARLTKRGLSFERACQYRPRHRDCWLRRDLDRWNKVLHPGSLELVETMPGSLAILSTSTTRRLYYSEDDVRTAVYVIRQLPKVHRCVQHIKLDGEMMWFLCRLNYNVALTLCHSANLQHLELYGWRGTSIFCGEELSEALEGLRHLKSITFCCLPVRRSMSLFLTNLLVRNACQLTALTLADNSMLRDTMNSLLRALQCCRFLSELSIVENSLSTRSVAYLAKLLRTSKSLAKLALNESLGNNVSLYALSEALKVNTSLIQLHVCQCGGRLEVLFEALAVNSTLQCLDLNGCNIYAGTADSLATALEKNTGLKKLILDHAHLDNDSVRTLARGLEANRSLETICLTRNSIDVSAVKVFSTMLRKNKTLKSVEFGYVEGSEQERLTLAFQMAEDKAYSRIQMIWTEPDFLLLSAAVANPSESPTELHLICHFELIKSNVCAVLEKLATNKHVKSVRLSVATEVHREVIAAMCSVLSTNKTIQNLAIRVASGESDRGLFGEVAQALYENNTVTNVRFSGPEVTRRSANCIASMLLKNTTIVSLNLDISHLPSKRLAIVSRALIKNHSVVEFRLARYPFTNKVSFRVFRATSRNVGLLNMAARFVTREKLDGEAARAFDDVCGKASLVPHIMNVTKHTESKIQTAVLSAKCFVQNNYFQLAGIVKENIVCHPGLTKQFDSLNHYCRVAIAQYLKLSDVLAADNIEKP